MSRRPPSSDDAAASGDKVVRLRKTRPCPICGKPSDRHAWPFCSDRCAQVDLNRWLTGAYAIPVVEEDGGPDDGSTQDD